ncbi:MAG: hypothetical protein ACR2JT_07165 [Nocardioidaceae bacterium]
MPERKGSAAHTPPRRSESGCTPAWKKFKKTAEGIVDKGWALRQPFHGIFVWRSPTGRIYIVDHTETLALSA